MWKTWVSLTPACPNRILVGSRLLAWVRLLVQQPPGTPAGIIIAGWRSPSSDWQSSGSLSLPTSHPSAPGRPLASLTAAGSPYVHDERDVSSPTQSGHRTLSRFRWASAP